MDKTRVLSYDDAIINKGEPMGHEPAQVRIEEGGRIFLPSSICNELHLKEGDMLVISVKDNKLSLEPFLQKIKKAQALLKPYLQEGRILSEELVQERKLAAQLGE